MMKHTSGMWGLAAAASLWLAGAPAAAAQRPSIPAPARTGSTPGTPSAFAGAEGDKKPAAPAPIVDTEYRMGPGDKLRVEVYKDQQLSQSVQIRPDGKITLPLVGDVEASGRTPLELRDRITTSLKEYMTNPVVTVIVVEAIAAQVFIMGEVGKSGPIPLNGPTTVLQALAMAGGFREFANTKAVKVLRPTANGTMQTLRFNYKDAISGDEKPLFLRAGDTIIVP
jgi:polysaccharide export outer membrane protein